MWLAMKKIILSILVTVLLSGCMAGAVVAGGAAGTSVGSDRRSFQMMALDDRIASQARHQISYNPDLKAKAHIVVAVYNRVVLLAGQAPTPELRAQAVQIVQGVPKVRRIFNEIEIATPTSALTRSEDAATTANVKTRMLATTNLQSSRFKVVTEDGTVYLMGLASRKQADIASQITRNSTGVQKVVKLIEYSYDDEDVDD